MTGPLNLFDILSVQNLQFMNRFPPVLKPFYDKIKTQCTNINVFLLKKVKRSWA